MDTQQVARRVTSEKLIGRASQIATLRDTVAATAGGNARIVLITGDAGIGKTRLVREVVAHVQAAGGLTAVGGCVQLGEVSVAFAPLVEALRDLRSQLAEDDFLEALGSARAPLQALLTGEAERNDVAGGVLEHVLGLINRTAARRPLLVVLEDLHWADASTRDLVAYLGRNLRNAAVTLLLTLRADELHRRHPLRPVVAGLEREPQVERLHLDGLTRSELARLLPEIGIAEPDEILLDDLAARTAGNPLYVEELVAAGEPSGGLPDTLAEVILSRVERLPDDVRRLLRAAAVIDSSVDDELVAAVTALPIDEVTSGLRRAVDEQVLVLHGGSCRFRHALVREALYDDLLPGERTRLHLATAEVLERAEHLAPHSRWALVAYHWDSGRDADRAYAASVRAAEEAERVHAYADAAEQYERALALRAQVADPDSVGPSLSDLLLQAADAVQAGSRSSRAVILLQAALDELPPDAAPERRARILERLGLTNWTLQHGAAAVAAYEQAAALVADRPPSPDKAFVLAQLGRSLMVRAMYEAAMPVIRSAIEAAEEVGAVDVEGHARCSLAPCLQGLGRVDEALAEIGRAARLARTCDDTDAIARSFTNLSHCAYQANRLSEIERAADEGLEYVAAAGRAHHHGEAIAGNVIAALHATGRWAEAEAIHDDPRIPNGDPYQELRWLPVLLDSGRLEEARVCVKTALEGTADADDVQFGALSLLLAARLHLIDEQWDDARRLVADALPLIERTDEHFHLSKAYALGLAVEADRVASGAADTEAVSVAEDLHARLQQARRRLLARGVVLLPEPAAWFVHADAEVARSKQADEPEQWATAAAAWESIGHPFPRATALLRQAQALLRQGGREAEAIDLVAAAESEARRIGAHPLAEEIASVRARAGLDGARPALPVTPRELDVLRLLAQGRTNRQIGETLFISEKTASVHVTNLLRKLGVTTRVEAAALAVRTGMT